MVSDELLRRVEQVYTALKELAEEAGKSGNYGVERTARHMMSHAQTLLESLKRSEAGYSL